MPELDEGRDMPRVGSLLLEATIYLYEGVPAAERAAALGGSGVLVGVEACPENPGGGPVSLVFVTCDHVSRLGAPVVRLVDRNGGITIEDPHWRRHPDLAPDVAAAYFCVMPSGGSDCPFSYIPIGRFATADDMAPRPRPANGNTTREQPYYFGNLVGPGDDTVMVGRFLAEDGVLSQTPTVRFGNLASGGPIEVVFEDQRRPSTQNCLLVESRSLPGYSGSVVYHYHDSASFGGLYIPVGDFDNALWRFLGIDCAHMNQRVSVTGLPAAGWTPSVQIPGRPRSATVNAGMMTVVPAWEVLRAVEAAMES